MIRFVRFGLYLGACWLCVGLFCMSFSCIFCREVLPSILYVCRGGFMIRLGRFGSHVGACLLRVGFIFREFCIIFQILILCAFFIVCRPRLIWWLVFPTCPQSHDRYMYVVVSVLISILMDLCHWLRCRSVVRQLCITFASIDSVCFVLSVSRWNWISCSWTFNTFSDRMVLPFRTTRIRMSPPFFLCFLIAFCMQRV